MTRICYISRNYKTLKSAGGIARTSIETILDGMGAVNLGLPQRRSRNSLVHGAHGFISMMRGLSRLRRGDVLVVQYPVKAYLPLILKVAKAKGAHVVALLIDIDSFREKSLTPEQEIKLLNRFDVVLTHNSGMRRWMTGHGITAPMVDYEIMDYLHGESEDYRHVEGKPFSLYYVGGLAENRFIYDLARIMPGHDIYAYSPVWDHELAASLPNFHPMGFVQDIEIIEKHSGDFGLSWYGESLDTGVGKYGEYMYVNNPYKVGLYLRCNTPVIAWKHAGRAEVIERDGLGITVGTLHDLPAALDRMTDEDYLDMQKRVREVNGRLATGWYLRKAMDEALRIIASRDGM